MDTILTHFSQMFHLYIPWKRQKTKGFLTFLWVIGLKHWAKMGQDIKLARTLIKLALGNPDYQEVSCSIYASTTNVPWISVRIHRFASSSFTLISVGSKFFFRTHKNYDTSLFFTSIKLPLQKTMKTINMSNTPLPSSHN